MAVIAPSDLQRTLGEHATAPSERRSREKGADEEDGADGDAEGVVADVAGLQPADAVAAPPYERADAVDRAVDDRAGRTRPRRRRTASRAADEGRDGRVDVPAVGQHGRFDLRPGRPCPGGRRLAARTMPISAPRSGQSGEDPASWLVVSRRGRPRRSGPPARASARGTAGGRRNGRLSTPPTVARAGQHDERERHLPRRLVRVDTRARHRRRRMAARADDATACATGAACSSSACVLVSPPPSVTPAADCSASPVAGVGLAPARLAEEHEEHLAAHVEGGQERGDEPDGPQRGALVVRGQQDVVLRPEAGERGHAGDGQPADDERDRGDRHDLAQRRPCAACPARRPCRG